MSRNGSWSLTLGCRRAHSPRGDLQASSELCYEVLINETIIIKQVKIFWMNDAYPYLHVTHRLMWTFLKSACIPHHVNHMFCSTDGRYRNACVRCLAFKVTRGNAYSVIVLVPGLSPACERYRRGQPYIDDRVWKSSPWAIRCLLCQYRPWIQWDSRCL